MSRHVMRNAMLPMLTALGPIVPDLITGSIFIEAIFRIPGLGRFWVTSTFERDYPMIIGLVMLWAVLIAVTYLITDILVRVHRSACSLPLMERTARYGHG